MTNTSFHTTTTPDDVEFVPASDIAIGDVLVAFTAYNVDVVIPPTATQLKRKRTGYTTVSNITHGSTPFGVVTIEFNAGTGDWSLTMPSTRMWRIKRSR